MTNTFSSRHLAGHVLALLFALSPAYGLAATASPSKPGQDTPAKAAPTAGGAPAPATAPEPASELKPYDKVITTEAKTQNGLIRLHTLKNRLYFEIPKELLDQPLLMVATATAVPEGADHVGRTINENVVRFTLRHNRLLFQSVSHAYVSDPSRPIAPAVQGSQRDTILASFPVEALSKEGAPVVEVSRLFTSEVGDFTARQVVRGVGLDGSRSYVEQSKAFAGSVRVDAVHTYNLMAAPTPPLPPIPGVLAPPPAPGRSGSVNVAYSLVKLPEQPMRARLMDDRVGFFSVSQVDFGSDEHESKRQRFITRWRLEKKEPEAALSEPIKPVVWYIDRATPTALVPFIKKGVEAWNVAFQAAGFKNAIQARPFPSKEEDPEFDPEDVRYSIIRWVPSPIPNAYGPHLSDPRSGEILNANIVMYHNIMQLQRNWYVTQVGAVDPRAQSLPLPDDLMGELVAYVVTHEVGHSLGFPHNMKSSSLYPVEKLRDAQWLKEMGHVATLMDYSRFNYLVQPEDKIDPALLIPKIGPYDIFATQWGYTPIPEAKTPEEERPTLNRWARQQDDKPWLRFSSPKAEGADYGENTEAVGDADAVVASGLGVKNLKRTIKMLPGMVKKDGRDDRLLEELYRATGTQWATEMGHVLAIVGGYSTRNLHSDQPGAIFTPAPRERQQRAVKFLSEQVFTTPQWLLEPSIIERLRPSEPARNVRGVQVALLRALIDAGRSARLQAQEVQLGEKAYRFDELLLDLRQAIYGEHLLAQATKGRADPVRRALQLSYLELLAERLNGPGLDNGRAALRAELKDLRGLFAARAAGSGDRVQRAHLEALQDYAAKALDPRQVPVAAAPAATVRSGIAEQNCWPVDSGFDADPGLVLSR
ncbi:zinc-dependent metalloprotease [Paucibacter sp. APW11]|uniref:Zinc-dependent metalloprotease n=1 Tax=Roseateles aquae TaxID=3077235 RepID=A0ABU3P6A4_9BURK|nr:zinc-dependent metalloprotease [Paucibacter sp. APW11]MDT8998099.1 zinc-dependent metalloprotease [Paucibacter sp. APW11]